MTDALLNTIFASAVGYDTAFWWIAGIFASGAVVCGLLLRSGPLVRAGAPPKVDDRAAAQTETSPEPAS
jgi:hypothetical protein